MAKTLFNSSEKSNFILNMTEEQYAKLASFGMLAACFTVPLFTIPAECLSTVTYSFASGGLAVSGVACLILAMIAIIKKYINRRVVLPLCAFGAMLLWSVVSMINGYDINVSLYGFPQRGEGILAILFYFCFFVTAASVKRERALNTLINGIIGAGLLNSAWAILQFCTDKVFAYKFMTSSRLKEVLQQSSESTDKSVAASGLSQSPIFLAMLLTLSLTAALIGFIMSNSKKRSIFCIVSACIFSFTMILTYTLVGVCGIIFAIIAAAASVFIAKAPKKKLASLAAAAASAILAVILAATGVIGNETSYSLNDGYLLWTADSFQRISASGNYDPDILNIENTKDVYSHLNRETIEIIKKYPLTGTGPEQLVYPQLKKEDAGQTRFDDLIFDNPNTFDKVYNEYLYTAATRGIPSLLALLAVILPVLFIGLKHMKQQRDEISICMFFLTLGGALIFLIGCSNIAFSPVFWAAAGGSCAAIEKAASKNKK